MTKELQEKLYTKYPLIFQNKDKSMKESCMYWGISTNDGWYKIIDRLCSNLQWNTDHNKQPQIIASQVKEKFGGLCFYVESGTSEQHAVISFVESLSHHVCEECGSMENVGHTKGWITTLCKKCVKDNENWKEYEK